jgi:hypothetical protein
MPDNSTQFVVERGFDNEARMDPPHPPRMGDLCPACGKGRLDTNGLLELECPLCGYRNTGGAVGT